MFVLDANVLLDAVNQRSACHTRCLALVEKCRTGTDICLLTWSICYEFLRVSTDLRALPSPLLATDALRFLESLMASDRFSMLVPTEQHASVLRQTLNENPHVSGNVMHDVHVAVLMREHGIRRIYTRDTDFHKFKFLDPIDPTVGAD